MCIQMEVKKIMDTRIVSNLTDKKTSIPTEYIIIKLWLDDECVEQQKEKFYRYFYPEVWLYATKLIDIEEVIKDMKQIMAQEEAIEFLLHNDTEVDFQDYQEKFFEKCEITIEAPFILWYALEEYNTIRIEEITTEIDTYKKTVLITKEEEIDIFKLQQPYQILFTIGKDQIKRKVIQSLCQSEKELQHLIDKMKQKDIILKQQEMMDTLITKTNHLIDATDEILKFFSQK